MFEWHENFSVKIPFIDEQHKKIFEIAERVYGLLQDYNGEDSFEEIMDEIDELERYSRYHFKEEELMMQKCNYKNLAAHKEAHQNFVDHFSNLDIIKVNGKQKETLEALVKFVAKWIFRHISIEDFKYSECVRTVI